MRGARQQKYRHFQQYLPKLPPPQAVPLPYKGGICSDAVITLLRWVPLSESSLVQLWR